MKVAAVKRKFGKNEVGVPFEMQDKIAKVLIKVGKLEAVTAEVKPEISPRTGQPKRQYQRRDMRAED